MELELGGPVWHASVRDPTGRLSADALEARAREELAGVGDPSLGEWMELGDVGVLHIRRRLSVDEAPSVGPVVDVRGTWEATRRLNRVRRYLPPAWRIRPDCELP